MLNKCKILETRRGFDVWKRRDYGPGFAWDFVQRFKTRWQAERFIQKSSKREGVRRENGKGK